MNGVTGTAIVLSWYPDTEDYDDVVGSRGGLRVLRARAVVLLVAALGFAAAGAVWRHPPLAGLGVAVLLCGMVAAWRCRVRVVPLHPALGAAVHVEVDPRSGLTMWAHRSTGFSVHHSTDEFPWTSIHRVRETDRVFLVQVRGRHPGVVLAKRGLNDPRELSTLRSLLYAAARPEGHN